MTSDLLIDYLESLHREFRTLDHGAVANYIPELSRADPQGFGITLVTVDGHVYQVGDTRLDFTIQSISKVLTYGIGLEDASVPAVLTKIDVEPSGEAFNSISLEPHTGRPRNPMINAGAIATMAFINGATNEQKLARILGVYKNYLGYAVSVDEAVYGSEKETGHRNRAIAHMLRNYDIIESGAEELLDLYFKQCSILVNCRGLALIAATLANNGVNPITGVRAVKSEFVPKLLSVMSSCGMYDFSGAWIYDVGMPAKSGVSGGVMAVLPGQLGIAVYSPKLDERGNSVRGIAVCKRISVDFGLHMFHTSRITATSAIHSCYDGSSVSSKLARNKDQAAILKTAGTKIGILELHGDLLFGSTEIVVSEVSRLAKSADYLVVDFRRVLLINEGAMNLLAHLVAMMEKNGKHLLFTNVRDTLTLSKVVARQVPHVARLPLLRYGDIDSALEWCEDALLSDNAYVNPTTFTLREQVICEGLTEAELEHLESYVTPFAYKASETICRAGDPANELFFILSGQINVLVAVGFRRNRRITTISAGAAFGEMGLLDHGVRSADVVAATDVTGLVLPYRSLEMDATTTGHSIRFKLIANIGRELTYKLRQATDEIKSLKS